MPATGASSRVAACTAPGQQATTRPSTRSRIADQDPQTDRSVDTTCVQFVGGTSPRPLGASCTPRAAGPARCAGDCSSRAGIAGDRRATENGIPVARYRGMYDPTIRVPKLPSGPVRTLPRQFGPARASRLPYLVAALVAVVAVAVTPL